MNRLSRLMALVAVACLVAAACSSNKPSTGGGSPSGGKSALPGAGTTVCYVSDTGGVDDKSFNQKIHNGFLRAQKELGINYKFVESTTAADYEPNLLNFVNQDCDLIAPAGFNFGPATVKSATANPDQKYAIFDYNIFDFTKSPPEDLTFPNVREITFQTDQAAFLGGYLAAGMTKSGKVATYGGVLFPTVTIFMNGLSAGIRAYNKDNGTHVQVLGWNADTQKGTQISPDPAVGFDNAAEGRRVTEDFISEGADIILPVAGPTGLGTMAAIQDAGGDVKGLWVDDDGCISAPEFCKFFLTSILKLMDNAAFNTTKDVIDGKFTGGLYVGTLENGGVDLAPYHEFDSVIPQALKDKIDELKKGIIAGTVSVDPKDYPAS